MQGWHLETQTKNVHRLDDAKVGEYNLHWHYNGILCSKEKRSQQTTGGLHRQCRASFIRHDAKVRKTQPNGVKTKQCDVQTSKKEKHNKSRFRTGAVWRAGQQARGTGWGPCTRQVEADVLE